jgi:GntR family transcriptional regulator, transcriptional repressor for pyruvate dehydrogenase complex
MAKGPDKKSDNRARRNNSSKTVSKEITDKLLRRVVDGEYPAGTKLPTERELAEEFGVNRIMVREALKRIETLGLLNTVQGSGSYVEDIDTRGGLELVDLLLLREDQTWNLKILRDMLEFHEFTVANAMKFAALRMSQDEFNNIERLVVERGQLLDNEERSVEITLEISRAIVEASHNTYIHLLFNSVMRLAESFRELFELPAHLDMGVQKYFESLIDAFKQKDAELAMLLTSRIFETYTRNLSFDSESSDRDLAEGDSANRRL